MGMYTEIHFNARLKNDTPNEVLAVLSFMVGDTKDKPSTPQHTLFYTERWRFMLMSDSYYFAADTNSTLRYDDIAETHFLCVRSNLKNYDDEINKFADWINEWVDAEDGDFLGFSRYEESEEPTLIRKGS